MKAKHFEFKDWQAAFRVYYAACLKYSKEKIQFVISTDFYTSGYWIEKAGTKLTHQCIHYPHEEVGKLRERVKQEIAAAESAGRSPSLVI